MTSGKQLVLLITSGLVIYIMAVVIMLVVYKNKADQAEEARARSGIPEIEITIGDTPLSAYHLVSRGASSSATSKLKNYVEDSTGVELPSFGSTDEHKITLMVDALMEEGEPEIYITNSDIYLRAKTESRLKELVDIAANAFFGYAFAGEEREHLLPGIQEIRLPAEEMPLTDAWMKEREVTICLWDTQKAMGAYTNPNTDQACQILSYSDDQLYSYVKMVREMGYTGIQVTDICAAWAAYGNYDFVQQRLRFLADAAHSLGMKFTLWVWGAQFDGYGWIDRSVKYFDPACAQSYEDPEVLATYEKYYDIYAELADCSDRVIVHFFEPGHTNTMEEVAYYTRLLGDRFREKNPSVDVGVNVYAQYIDLSKLTVLLGETARNYTFYTLADRDGNTSYANPRVVASNNSLPYGVWSWAVCDREIDQQAMFCVNAQYAKRVYQRTAVSDSVLAPSYWSEMDSYHNANVFSLYVAGQLLQDPGQNADELLMDAARAVAGKENAEKLYAVLSLVQDARTGPEGNVFTSDAAGAHVSASYDPEAILARSETAIGYLEELAKAPDAGTLTMAISREEFYRMLLPHVLQIRDFAKFYKGYLELLEMEASGEARTELAGKMQEIYVPISEYNVITGMWGVTEQRMERRLCREFCDRNGIVLPQDAEADHAAKERIYAEFVSQQQVSSVKLTFATTATPHMAAAYGEVQTRQFVEEMIRDGLLTVEDDDTVSLTDWERYQYNF